MTNDGVGASLDVSATPKDILGRMSWRNVMGGVLVVITAIL
jgi:hypothetical protein